MTRADMEACFPQITQFGYSVTSAAAARYNCIAWAAGDTRKWWWPDPIPFAYWPPPVPRENTLSRFVEAFRTLGYEPCDNSAPEPGFEKIAVYADADGFPTHAARQLENGSWTSKLGREEDIEHHALAGLEGQEYGHGVQILSRPR